MTDYAGLAARLAQLREAAGLDLIELADAVGIEPASYVHLESDDWEFMRQISLGQARRICTLLNTPLLSLLETYAGVPAPASDRWSMSDFSNRHVLICDALLARGLDEDALSDLWGWTVNAVQNAKRSSDYLEALPVEAIVELSRLLGIPSARLIGQRGF